MGGGGGRGKRGRRLSGLPSQAWPALWYKPFSMIGGVQGAQEAAGGAGGGGRWAGRKARVASEQRTEAVEERGRTTQVRSTREESSDAMRCDAMRKAQSAPPKFFAVPFLSLLRPLEKANLPRERERDGAPRALYSSSSIEPPTAKEEGCLAGRRAGERKEEREGRRWQ